MDPNLIVTNGARLTLREIKQSVVAADGIGTDVAPYVVTAERGQIIGAYEMDPDDSIKSTSTFALSIVLSNADLVVHGIDAYLSTPDYDGGMEDLPHRFGSGDPSVIEGLLYVSVDRHLQAAAHYDPYRYEGKRVVWLNTRIAHSEFVRAFVEQTISVARGAFRHQQQRGGAPVLTQRNPGINYLGHHHVTPELIIAELAVAKTCPCGSGKPSDACCAPNN
jgi:hypothetical protein